MKRRTRVAKSGKNRRLLPGDGTTADIGRVIRPLAQDTYTLSESFALGSNLVSSAALLVAAGYSHALSDLPSVSAWTAIFDRYRILRVYVDFTPLATTNNTGTNQLGYLHTAVDFDDATAPATTAAIERYSTYRAVVGCKPLRRAYVPRLSATVYYNGVVNAYAEAPSQTWLDMANTSVPHYGLKAGLDPTTVAGQVAYVTRATYVIEVSGRR